MNMSTSPATTPDTTATIAIHPLAHAAYFAGIFTITSSLLSLRFDYPWFFWPLLFLGYMAIITPLSYSIATKQDVTRADHKTDVQSKITTGAAGKPAITLPQRRTIRNVRITLGICAGILLIVLFAG